MPCTTTVWTTSRSNGHQVTQEYQVMKSLMKKPKKWLQELYANVKELQKEIFNQSKKAGYTLSIDPSLPSPTFLKLTKDFQKRHTATIFQLCTGHAPLKAPSPSCDYCDQPREMVTHFLMECTHFSVQRTYDLATLLNHPKCI